MPSKILLNLFKLREEGDVEKPFVDHLEDLRWSLLKGVVVFAVAVVGAFFFRGPLSKILLLPLASVDPEMPARLQSLAPADSITISFRLAFYAGFITSFPLLLYFALEFILPGLNRKERRVVIPIIGIGILLFLIGVAFCYFWVLPMTLAFFFNDAKTLGLLPQWTFAEYLAFVTQFTIAFGLCFQLPLVVIFLVKIELLTASLMRRTRSYATIIICVLAAAITPTTDILTLLCMAGPMLLLYEGSILLAKHFEPPPTAG